jgi:hypothetical protein
MKIALLRQKKNYQKFKFLIKQINSKKMHTFNTSFSKEPIKTASLSSTSSIHRTLIDF